MVDSELLTTIRRLEIALHQPENRIDRQVVDTLLHPDFVEFGYSGRMYAKSDVIENLRSEQSNVRIWSQDYRLQVLADRVVLLTYKSARFAADGSLTRHSLRASVWKRMAMGWQMIFHQGTPTASFADHAL